MNPLLSPGCGRMYPANSSHYDWVPIPISLTPNGMLLALRDFNGDLKGAYIGVKLQGDVFAEDAAQNLNWFTYHEPHRNPIYHRTSLEALTDPAQWLPPEFDWSFAGSTDRPGYMDWNWWQSCTRGIDEAFKTDGISTENWNASPGRQLHNNEDIYSKVVVICKNEMTGQHLGFELYHDDGLNMQLYPFIIARDTVCSFYSVAEALMFPQDAMGENAIERVTAAVVARQPLKL